MNPKPFRMKSLVFPLAWRGLLLSAFTRHWRDTGFLSILILAIISLLLPSESLGTVIVLLFANSAFMILSLVADVLFGNPDYFARRYLDFVSAQERINIIMVHYIPIILIISLVFYFFAVLIRKLVSL